MNWVAMLCGGLFGVGALIVLYYGKSFYENTDLGRPYEETTKILLKLVNRQSTHPITELTDENAFEPLVMLLEKDRIVRNYYLHQSLQMQIVENLTKFGTRSVLPLVSYITNDERGNSDIDSFRAEWAGMSVVTYGALPNNVYLHTLAVRALGDIGDTRAVPALLETLQTNRYWRLLHDVSETINKLADATVVAPLCKILLNDADVGRRAYAASALKGFEDKQAIEALSTALSDEDVRVAVFAARALGTPYGQSAVPALIKALKNDNRQYPTLYGRGYGRGGITVSGAALEALLKIGAIDELIELLFSDSDILVRMEVAFAFNEVDDDRVIRALSTAISDSDEDLALSAAMSLGRPYAKAAVPFLIEALNDKRQSESGLIKFSKIVCDALKHIGTPEALAAVKAYERNQNTPPD